MSEPDSAPMRFAIISGARLLAALMIVGGIVIGFGDRAFVDEALKLPVGIALIIAGFVDMLLVVPWLIRRWRSPQ